MSLYIICKMLKNWGLYIVNKNSLGMWGVICSLVEDILSIFNDRFLVFLKLF